MPDLGLTADQLRIAMPALLNSQDDFRNAKFLADLFDVELAEAHTITEFELLGVRFTSRLVIERQWMHLEWSAA